MGIPRHVSHGLTLAQPCRRSPWSARPTHDIKPDGGIPYLAPYGLPDGWARALTTWVGSLIKIVSGRPPFRHNFASVIFIFIFTYFLVRITYCSHTENAVFAEKIGGLGNDRTRTVAYARGRQLGAPWY